MAKIKQTLVSGVALTDKQSLLPIMILSDRILIEYMPPKRTVSGGAAAIEQKDSKVLLAGNTQEDYSWGLVKSVGPGNSAYPVKVEVGQVVQYFRHQAIKDFTLRVPESVLEKRGVTMKQLLEKTGLTETELDIKYDLIRASDCWAIV